MIPEIFDFVVIGSGFGGSVSALRLVEKGYSVLVIERGRRFSDDGFPRTNWDVRRYLWAPWARCFGFLQMSFFRGLLVLHGSGVGGGSLGYAGVLMAPDPAFFSAPGWRDLADWEMELSPHFATARRMLGVAENPRLWKADRTMEELAGAMGRQDTFRPTEVGVFFGEPGEEVADPYFGGKGPARCGCTHCGGCMVGCRYNAKNTLVKNYLYLAEQHGAQVLPEAKVVGLRPVADKEGEGARYRVGYRRTSAWLGGAPGSVLARNVVVAAGVLGTLEILFRARDVAKTLPKLSPRLGENARTNSEDLLGVTSRSRDVDFSEGVAISSGFEADDHTFVEPVRYARGSSFMRLMATPMIEAGESVIARLARTVWAIARAPLDFLTTIVGRGWAERTTIVLVMQQLDNRMRVRYLRRPWKLMRHGLVIEHDRQARIPSEVNQGHHIAREFAKKVEGIPQGSFVEGLLNMPITAHILGGVPMGTVDSEGVIDKACRVFNYPGLYVVDGSVVPANPGINPTLTITALAEYAMAQIPDSEPSGYHGE